MDIIIPQAGSLGAVVGIPTKLFQPDGSAEALVFSSAAVHQIPNGPKITIRATRSVRELSGPSYVRLQGFYRNARIIGTLGHVEDDRIYICPGLLATCEQNREVAMLVGHRDTLELGRWALHLKAAADMYHLVLPVVQREDAVTGAKHYSL